MRIEKDQLYAFGAAAVLLGVFIVGVLMPLHNHRVSYQACIDAAKKTLGLDLAETKGLSKLDAEVASLRQVVNSSKQFVPQDDELADVLRGLSEALDAYGVREREVKTQTTQQYEKFSVIPITVEYRASFPAVFGVLRRIERMQRLIRVDDLNVRNENDGDLQPLEVKLSLSTFIARQVTAEDE